MQCSAKIEKIKNARLYITYSSPFLPETAQQCQGTGRTPLWGSSRRTPSPQPQPLKGRNSKSSEVYKKTIKSNQIINQNMSEVQTPCQKTSPPSLIVSCAKCARIDKLHSNHCDQNTYLCQLICHDQRLCSNIYHWKFQNLHLTKLTQSQAQEVPVIKSPVWWKCLFSHFAFWLLATSSLFGVSPLLKGEAAAASQGKKEGLRRYTTRQHQDFGRKRDKNKEGRKNRQTKKQKDTQLDSSKISKEKKNKNSFFDVHAFDTQLNSWILTVQDRLCIV